MKKLLSICLIIALCFALSPNTVSAAVKLSQKTAVVIEGDYLYLSIKGSSKKVTWTSSDKYIASVSKKGKVTTKGAGKVNIIAKVGNKKYTCKVVIIPNIDPNYKTDRDVENELAEREYIDNFSTDIIIDESVIDDENAQASKSDKAKELEDRINKMNQYGFASSEDLDTELGKAYIEFCSTWVSEYELVNSFGISVLWDWSEKVFYFCNHITFINCTVVNVEDNYNNGEQHISDGITYKYIEVFECNGDTMSINELFFSREDLINKGIIK